MNLLGILSILSDNTSNASIFPGLLAKMCVRNRRGPVAVQGVLAVGMCQIGGADTPRCMPRMPRDDEEERFDQRREDQVAVQGQPRGTPHTGQEPEARQHTDVEPMAAGAVGLVGA